MDETALERDLDLILGARPDPLDLLDLELSPEPEDEPEDEDEGGTGAVDEADDDEED